MTSKGSSRRAAFGSPSSQSDAVDSRARAVRHHQLAVGHRACDAQELLDVAFGGGCRQGDARPLDGARGGHPQHTSTVLHGLRVATKPPPPSPLVGRVGSRTRRRTRRRRSAPRRCTWFCGVCGRPTAPVQAGSVSEKGGPQKAAWHLPGRGPRAVRCTRGARVYGGPLPRTILFEYRPKHRRPCVYDRFMQRRPCIPQRHR